MRVKSNAHVSVIILFIVYICQHINCGWIDPDTPDSVKETSSNVKVGGKASIDTYKLVFSDEFNTNDRFFNDGYDSRWTAVNKNDYTNYALQYYDNDLVKTSNGKLVISTIVKDRTFTVHDHVNKDHKETKHYQSGMLQGWNKFCFTGGIVEISAKLPGQYDIGGLWPAMWLLGNLARATYVGSSNNMWPWSYDTCDTDLQHQQIVSACNKINHFQMHSNQGRGAPEIDILEAMPGNETLPNTRIKKPYFSSSLQVAPGYRKYRPDNAQIPESGMWYDKGLEYAEDGETCLNIFFYGMSLEGATPAQSYTADAISANTNIASTHFDEFHKYRIEWITGDKGYLKWYLDDKFLFSIDSYAFHETGAVIPEEPMYLIFNTAVSSTWGFPVPCPEDCDCSCVDPRKEECACAMPSRMAENFPNEFQIDYVRVYQNEEDENQIVGCSTVSHPTKTYILGHQNLYMNDGDTQPLQPLVHGGGECTVSSDCGSGSCDKGKCICNNGYVGPTCLASLGFNDIDWEPESPFTINFLFLPTPLIILLVAVFISSIALVVYRYNDNRMLQFKATRSSSHQYTSINMNASSELPIVKNNHQNVVVQPAPSSSLYYQHA